MAQQLNVIEKAAEKLTYFKLDGEPILCRRFGQGHINDTYLVADDTARLYVLQKINGHVFTDPLMVMNNILAVISHLARKDEPNRGMLALVPALDGKLWHVDAGGEYWRIYSYIADSICYQSATGLDMFRECGYAFGTFQRKLADFPMHTLGETIKGFHDTPARYKTFKSALGADACDRVKDAAPEIDFVLERESRAGALVARQAEGALPLRVTHNDTKLNNVLFDRWTGKSLCVIDLDTVMPGLSVMDFGDAIRFGASTADEDERDLDKVSLSMELFSTFTEGFLNACGADLTRAEVESMCDGAHIITLEIGMRFLTDYINGDVYFKTAYAEHNLIRCRTQFKLVADMEARWDEMQKTIGGLYKA